ncbi:MAG: RsmG family class I SAM-dependent methyltransferase [Microthrixaceae bacterium]
MTDDDLAPDAPRPVGPGSTQDAVSDRDQLGSSSDVRRAALRDVLTESRRLGFLGPGPIEDHVVHAMGFVPLVGGASDVLDLGSGGGLPGLVLMTEVDAATFVLLDASTRRCEFLGWAVERLGLADRATVVCGRAEELAHDPGLRGRFQAVVARSFGAPAVTAECAVGFLDAPGSRLLVSEPPDAADGRWPSEGLGSLGLRAGERLQTGSSTIQVLELATMPPPTIPRRVGVPSKRPRF